MKHEDYENLRDYDRTARGVAVSLREAIEDYKQFEKVKNAPKNSKKDFDAKRREAYNFANYEDGNNLPSWDEMYGKLSNGYNDPYWDYLKKQIEDAEKEIERLTALYEADKTPENEQALQDANDIAYKLKQKLTNDIISSIDSLQEKNDAHLATVLDGIENDLFLRIKEVNEILAALSDKRDSYYRNYMRTNNPNPKFKEHYLNKFNEVLPFINAYNEELQYLNALAYDFNLAKSDFEIAQALYDDIISGTKRLDSYNRPEKRGGVTNGPSKSPDTPVAPDPNSGNPDSDPVEPSGKPSDNDIETKKARLEAIILIFIQLSLDNNVLTQDEKAKYLILVEKFKLNLLTDDEEFEYEKFKKRLIEQGIKLCVDVDLIQEYYLLIQIIYPELEFVTVNFKDRDGNVMTLLKFPKGEILPFIPDAPEVDDMDFAGWKLSDGTLLDVTQPINENIDLLATYRDRSYKSMVTVTFKDKDGNVLSSVQIPRGSTIENFPDAPNVDDMDFVGWTYTNGDLFPTDQKVEEDIDLVAFYKDRGLGEIVDVTFRDINGDIITTIPVAKGNKIEKAPIAPEVSGMDFAGWALPDGTPFNLNQPILQDMDLHASYRDRNKVKVTFIDTNHPEDPIRVSYVDRGELYDQLPPERDSEGRPLKPLKANGKVKKTFMLKGWMVKNENGEYERFNLNKTPIEDDIVLYTDYGFDWKRIASIGVGALAAVATVSLANVAPLVLAGAGLASTIGSFVIKNLVDHGYINKKQPITSVKTPSEKLKRAMRQASNKLKDRYFWDNILHASMGVTLAGGAMAIYDKIKDSQPDNPEPDPNKNPDVVPTENTITDPNYKPVYDKNGAFGGIDSNKPVYDNPNGINPKTLGVSDDPTTMDFYVESSKKTGESMYMKIEPGDTYEEILAKYQATKDPSATLEDLQVAAFNKGVGSEFGNHEYQIAFQPLTECTTQQALNSSSTISNIISDFKTLNPNADPAKLAERVTEFVTENMGPEFVSEIPDLTLAAMKM